MENMTPGHIHEVLQQIEPQFYTDEGSEYLISTEALYDTLDVFIATFAQLLDGRGASYDEMHAQLNDQVNNLEALYCQTVMMIKNDAGPNEEVAAAVQYLFQVTAKVVGCAGAAGLKVERSDATPQQLCDLLNNEIQDSDLDADGRYSLYQDTFRTAVLTQIGSIMPHAKENENDILARQEKKRLKKQQKQENIQRDAQARVNIERQQQQMDRQDEIQNRQEQLLDRWEQVIKKTEEEQQDS